MGFLPAYQKAMLPIPLKKILGKSVFRVSIARCIPFALIYE